MEYGRTEIASSSPHLIGLTSFSLPIAIVIFYGIGIRISENGEKKYCIIKLTAKRWRWQFELRIVTTLRLNTDERMIKENQKKKQTNIENEREKGGRQPFIYMAIIKMWIIFNLIIIIRDQMACVIYGTIYQCVGPKPNHTKHINAKLCSLLLSHIVDDKRLLAALALCCFVHTINSRIGDSRRIEKWEYVCSWVVCCCLFFFPVAIP